MNKLSSYSIRDIHKAYRDKSLNPRCLIDQCLDRAKKSKELNAFITLTPQVAQEQSLKCQERLQSSNKLNMLEGISVSLKDNFCTKAELTSEILSKLNISINKLPPKSLKILQDCVKYRDLTLDPMSISLLETKVISEKFQDEYEILKLNQMNARLQMKIDRNNKYIEGLKKELLSSRQSLMQQNPNPENIHESIRQVKQKLAVYEQSCEKAKTNFASLKVDEVILPKSLMSLVTSLAALREEAANLKRDADDVLFMKEAVSNMKMIRG